VALVTERFPMIERRACKETGSWYSPRSDLRDAPVSLTRMKPRYGYRRRNGTLIGMAEVTRWRKTRSPEAHSPASNPLWPALPKSPVSKGLRTAAELQDVSFYSPV
jgi:hypothetical protein